MIRVLAAVALVVLVTGCLMSQPTWRRNRPSAATVAPQRLRAHVAMLSQSLHPRDWQHAENLERCADYIAAQFRSAGAAVELQDVPVQGRVYHNVIGRFGAGRGRKVIVGAHYDACGETPGADDNASGVAALIELASLLGHEPAPGNVELVAYVLEEPPFFKTPQMGSAVHARSVAAAKENVAGAIVLEMVGCFSDARGSQSYPSALLRLTYPSRGNFIAVVGRWDQGDWLKRVKVGMRGATGLPVCSLRAPAAVPGVDFSDHINYWPHAIDAVMVTDTAFYRNRVYHGPDDTADRLDYERMAQVVVAVFEAVRSIEAAGR